MNTLRKPIPIVIWGASGQALVVANSVRLLGIYEIVGYLDNVNPERKGELFDGATVLGGTEMLPELLAKNICHFAIGFGDCAGRLKLGKMLLEQGFELPPIVHPQAAVAASVILGQGTYVGACCVISPDTVIGIAAMINAGASIGHQCTIGGGVHIAPGAHIAGTVDIGDATWVGLGSNVIQNIRIGRNSVIGAGSTVIRDIPDNVVAFGVPARVQRELQNN